MKTYYVVLVPFSANGNCEYYQRGNGFKRGEERIFTTCECNRSMTVSVAMRERNRAKIASFCGEIAARFKNNNIELNYIMCVTLVV
jgi:hypothetical protein